MSSSYPFRCKPSFVLLAGLGMCTLAIPLAVRAQKEELQQRIAELKESMAKNKQALAQYTWRETDTVKLKGEVKKVSNFQVRTGPDGKPQKTSLDPPQQTQPPSGGKLKQRVVPGKRREAGLLQFLLDSVQHPALHPHQADPGGGRLGRWFALHRLAHISPGRDPSPLDASASILTISCSRI